jgi:hypothetical protein
MTAGEISSGFVLVDGAVIGQDAIGGRGGRHQAIATSVAKGVLQL